MAGIDVSKYAHSPVHNAVATKDYDGLKKIIDGLPRFRKPDEIRTEADSLAEEEKADEIGAVINRRDVPNRETALHLAVKLGDETATEILMAAGIDWSLQNEQGWSALQEAICKREEGIAKIIIRRYPPLAWTKWCRRLPRLVGAMRRMRDFYMEITFHFESSAIPFISRIAPSDTYKIWKRGANLRADMTLAGFDGLRIQRSDQSILFLGDGSEDEKLPPGSLCMISHKNREVVNAFESAGAEVTEEEVRQEVVTMSQTNIIRPGLNVTNAVLLPQVTWRRNEKTEMVGTWKAKVYDMHNVVISVKSRRVPGAMTDDELLANSNKNEAESEELDEILTEEEKKQLEIALKSDSSELSNENGYDSREIPTEEETNGHKNVETKHGKKGWFGGWRKNNQKHEGQRKNVPARSSLSGDEKASDLLGDSPSESQIKPGRHSVEARDDQRRTKDSKTSTSTSLESGNQSKGNGLENGYKKGLRPVLWLSPNFPLQIEELLPLLDILASKVKAIRRLRELLTTKLPPGTFPVKVAIPVVPTIRVLVSFTKFEELQPVDEFSTPPSSPRGGKDGKESQAATDPSGSSWLQWIKTPYHRPSSSNNNNKTDNNVQDPFAVPRDYNWISAEEKAKRMREKMKAKKAKNQAKSQNQKKPPQSNKTQ